ncbi:MAG TPA: hypothetical protein VHX59_21125 [Mycobacteriales bacterium]|jgi:hypothetical protein|nr:hypothetical protein [Mycobacteriales bacterium]
MAEWVSIEIYDGPLPASSWRDSYGEALTEAALTNGAQDWVWHEHRWGLVLEVLFNDDDAIDTFRELPAVRAALDAVPDPVNGLLVYRGRGGSSGVRVPRRPRPQAGGGAAALPEPTETGPVLGADLAVPTSPVHF